MLTARRWYILLVCAISLQSVTWAVIALLRALLIRSGGTATATAFQIAVIIIGLPIFLVHWLWAQRLAARETDERESALRRFYLYGTLAGSLSPIAANTFDLIANLLWLAFGRGQSRYGVYYEYSPTNAIIGNLVAIAVLAQVWFYHWWVTAEDAKAAPETGDAATVRRLYLIGFSAAGVWMTTLAVVNLLRWVMYQFGGGLSIRSSEIFGLTDEVTRLAVGVPLWLVFWLQAQRLFASSNEEERESALRKLYLYLIVLIASLTAVTNATLILAGWFRRLLDLPSLGDIREPLPLIIGMAVLWAYHTYVLHGDAARAGEAPRQADVRRLYLYLVAAVGLAAFLVGLSGDVNIFIRSLDGRYFGSDLKEQLAWFTAALIAGLPVWLLPWWAAQVAAVAASASGTNERRSTVRKIYLYFYLFVATMTVLSSAVYVAYQLLSIVLSVRGKGNLLTDLGQALAYGLIAIGVWLYHGSVLHGDGQLYQQAQAQRLAHLRVAVVDGGQGLFGRAILDGLRRELPALTLDPVGLGQASAAAMGMAVMPEQPEVPSANGQSAAIIRHLTRAGLIIGPWNLYVTGAQRGEVTADIAAAAIASPARKLLVPVWADGWEWAGVEHWNAEAITRQTVRAVKQIIEDDEVKLSRR